MSALAATRLLLMRHGETAWNQDARIQGHTDIELNATGHWQAGRLAAAVAEDPPDLLYCSDLKRARSTAEPLAARLRLALQPDPALRERCFGTFEGQRFVDIEARDPESARRWRQRDLDFQPIGGESLREFHARAVAAIEALCHRHAGRHIAVVSHGGVLDCLYRAATQTALDAPRHWAIHNACINRLRHGEQGFSLVVWGADQHLSGRPATDEIGPVA